MATMEDINKFMSLDLERDYENILVDGLRNSFPRLSEEELREAIKYSIAKRLYNSPASIDNNYSKRRLDGTVLDVLKYIEKLQPIVTSSGVLFKQHKEAVNPLNKMIQGFLTQRKAYKKEMFKHPKKSEEFEKYNLLQLLEKLNANACYGVLGNNVALIYNIYVAEAITRQGRSYISCSIMLFESFMANNVGFYSLNEVITFINNIEHEKNQRKLLDEYILDRDITIAECFYKLMDSIDLFVWKAPTDEEMMLIWDYLNGLSQEDINRIYYKNNLYSFCDLPIVTELIIKILSSLEAPFMNPNEPPEEIKENLDKLLAMIKEYVYYGYQYIDKLDRIEMMQRDIVCISDTDSTIISFDAWYRFILSKVYNIDMPIKREKFNMVNIIEADEFGDKPPREMVQYVEPIYDYNFYTDEVIEIERLIEPCKIIPQESLKYSIINILAYICGDLVVDYLEKYTTAANAYRPDDPTTKCVMIMKNEFLFERILLTMNKKNYADIQVLQEGNIIPKTMQASMAIMGLPISKSTLSKGIRDKLQEILYEEILTADKIDQIKVMKKLAILEKEIVSNVLAKKTDYYKPDNIAAVSTYADPMRINGITAAMIYNEMKSPDMSEINLTERNKIIKIKIDVNKKNVHKIKDKFPVEYEKLCKLLEHSTLGSRLSTIAIPSDSTVPDWVLEFVDVKTIVNDALKNFPLESIGLNLLGNNSVNYSNIIDI